ncbi:MAG: hypothetical protein NTY32_00555, partial [Bacteroidia bacterium]|nr:hypothetical protein [Bacteroidia bacterium]
MIGVLIQLNLSIQREARELQMDLFGEPPSPIVANTLTVTAVRGELMARGIQPWEPAIVEPRSRITPLPKEQPITAIGSIITDLGILAKTKKLDAKRVVIEVEKHLRLNQLLDDGQITPERIYGR